MTPVPFLVLLQCQHGLSNTEKRVFKHQQQKTLKAMVFPHLPPPSSSLFSLLVPFSVPFLPTPLVILSDESNFTPSKKSNLISPRLGLISACLVFSIGVAFQVAATGMGLFAAGRAI